MHIFKSQILLVFLLFSLPLVAQDLRAGRMHEKYLREKNDSQRIKYHLTYIALLDNPDQAEAEMTLVKEELRKSPNVALSCLMLYYEGQLKYNEGNYLESIISCSRSLKIYQPAAGKGTPDLTPGNIYIMLGLAYSMINDWENAQLNYQHAIRENEKTSDSAGTALAYMNMAYIYFDVNDWENARLTLKRGMAYLNANSSKIYQISIYASLAEACSRDHKLEEARTYLTKSDSLTRIYQDATSNTFVFKARGEYELSKKNYPGSLAAELDELRNARIWGDSSFVAGAMESMARVYLAMKRYKEAEYYLNLSKDIAVKHNYMPQRKYTLKQLFLLYKESKQSQKAIEMADELITISDSLATVQNNNRRIIMDAVFESENREKKIASLEQERELELLRLKEKNIFNYLLIAGVVILTVISLLSYRTYKQKQRLQQQRIRELEKDRQLVVVDAILKGQEEERIRLARDLHDGLGGLLSGVKFSLSNMKNNLLITPENMAVFERSLDMLDSSIKELRRVAHNMMPEMLTKYGLDEALKEYCHSINHAKLLTVTYQSHGMSKRLDQSTEIIIYRIVQELLNNILKHAGATDVFVQLIREESRLSVVVEDNGKGFDANLPENKEGAGLVNVRSRVDYLKGRLAIHAEPGKGTLINIEFSV
ncbi:MAG: histidine kinase [Bacteroidota bacterium]|nr:histidine kinase [Bacteroidota bacterium]MDP4216186.1 histidine kinase [Bacteroidota bacterium]